MNLSNIIPSAIAILRTAPALAAPLPILDQTDPGYTKAYAAAMQAPGVALVLIPVEGRPGAGGADVPRVDLVNDIIVSVVVSPAVNTTGRTAWQYVQLILATLHQATRATEAPGRHRFLHGDPAWQIGPLDTGLDTYNVHFRIKSLDTLSTPAT